MPLTNLHAQAAPAAGTWFSGPAGQALLASEAGCVGEALRQRSGPAGLWLGPQPAVPAGDGALAAVRLHWQDAGFSGDVRCGLPLPLASESFGVVLLQHAGDAHADAAALLEECARVLVPGGWLWLLALNPLSPYRLRWRGHGLRAREPVTWRRRLRAAGLAPDSLTQGLGPGWGVEADPRLQDGVGLRAAFLLRAEKRRLPLTPLRIPRVLGWQAGTPA